MRAQRHGPRQQAGVPVARLRQSQPERRDVRPRDQTAKIVQSSHRDVVLFPHYQDGPQYGAVRHQDIRLPTGKDWLEIFQLARIGSRSSNCAVIVPSSKLCNIWVNFNVSLTDRSRLGLSTKSYSASSSSFSKGNKVKPSSANTCAPRGPL